MITLKMMGPGGFNILPPFVLGGVGIVHHKALPSCQSCLKKQLFSFSGSKYIQGDHNMGSEKAFFKKRTFTGGLGSTENDRFHDRALSKGAQRP